MNALFWKNDIRSQGNPDLKPERSEHSDAGFEISLDKPIKISAGMTYFHSHVNDIIIWRPS
jgi:vitamin B12 transporter